ncbi:hypothetical protein OFC00_31395, partial [Escherichia coli]|nr:hypothetical protein [Escherichia coli]
IKTFGVIIIPYKNFPNTQTQVTAHYLFQQVSQHHFLQFMQKCLIKICARLLSLIPKERA